MKKLKYYGVLSLVIIPVLMTTTAYAFNGSNTGVKRGNYTGSYGMFLNGTTISDSDKQDIYNERLDAIASYLNMSESEIVNALKKETIRDLLAKKGADITDFRKYMRKKMTEYMTEKGIDYQVNKELKNRNGRGCGMMNY